MHLTSSFLHTISLFIPYAYFSNESIDCIFLSLFEIKAILLISPVFNNTILLMTNSSKLSASILFFSKWFILISI